MSTTPEVKFIRTTLDMGEDETLSQHIVISVDGEPYFFKSTGTGFENVPAPEAVNRIFADLVTTVLGADIQNRDLLGNVDSLAEVLYALGLIDHTPDIVSFLDEQEEL